MKKKKFRNGFAAKMSNEYKKKSPSLIGEQKLALNFRFNDTKKMKSFILPSYGGIKLVESD